MKGTNIMWDDSSPANLAASMLGKNLVSRNLITWKAHTHYHPQMAAKFNHLPSTLPLLVSTLVLLLSETKKTLLQREAEGVLSGFVLTLFHQKLQ